METKLQSLNKQIKFVQKKEITMIPFYSSLCKKRELKWYEDSIKHEKHLLESFDWEHYFYLGSLDDYVREYS